VIDVLKRLHILVGLFNLTALAVFALVGITETFPNRERHAESRLVDFEAPSGLDDQQVAERLVSALQLPLIGPVRGVHRNDRHVVEFEFYTTNGPGKAAVLEADRKARIDGTRLSFGRFMVEAHAASLRDAAPVLLMRLWAVYVDCSIFSLLFMATTGPWLWLASRPSLWWARALFAAGGGVFVVLWLFSR
jgi:hypothetical protein